MVTIDEYDNVWKDYVDEFILAERGWFAVKVLERIRNGTATEEEKAYCRKLGVYPHKKHVD